MPEVNDIGIHYDRMFNDEMREILSTLHSLEIRIAVLEAMDRAKEGRMSDIENEIKAMKEGIDKINEHLQKHMNNELSERNKQSNLIIANLLALLAGVVLLMFEDPIKSFISNVFK